jgi:hypothetical protein
MAQQRQLPLGVWPKGPRSGCSYISGRFQKVAIRVYAIAIKGAQCSNGSPIVGKSY